MEKVKKLSKAERDSMIACIVEESLCRMSENDWRGYAEDALTAEMVDMSDEDLQAEMKSLESELDND